jgi:hypothetical protein
MVNENAMLYYSHMQYWKNYTFFARDVFAFIYIYIYIYIS